MRVEVDIAGSRDLILIKISGDAPISNESLQKVMAELIVKLQEAEKEEKSVDPDAVSDANETEG